VREAPFSIRTTGMGSKGKKIHASSIGQTDAASGIIVIGHRAPSVISHMGLSNSTTERPCSPETNLVATIMGQRLQVDFGLCHSGIHLSLFLF